MVKHFYYLSSIGALSAEEDSVFGRSFKQFGEATNNPDNQKKTQSNITLFIKHCKNVFRNGLHGKPTLI